MGALYGANTLGAAIGALATGYALLPALGVLRTTLVAVALNALVALGALRWSRGAGGVGEEASAASEGPRAPAGVDGRARILGWVVLAFGGAVTLALEGVATHLLAVVVGNSAYAFSAMLFCFLLGLGLGSPIGRAWLTAGRSVPVRLGLAQALLAASVLGGVFAWSHVPACFELLGGLPVHLSFALREAIRLVVCALLLVPPARSSSARATRWRWRAVASDSADGRLQLLGRAAAVNTLGNVGGALVGSFALLPRLGSLHALQILGATSLGLAAFACAASNARERRRLAIALALGLGTLAFQPRTFDLTSLASGANVYFRAQGFGEAIDHAESASGGLTSVAVDTQDDGRVVKTLFTNGKFQGDDSVNREVKAQIAFGLVPLLHVEGRESALVIGFGTGTTARVVSDAGFAHVDVAELSRDIVTLADHHFASVNGHVALRPERARARHRRAELPPPRAAVVRSGHRRNFEHLVRRRVFPLRHRVLSAREAAARRGGVLQQWLQLHHLAREDYVAVLSSVRSVFRNVWLYEVGNQGLLVACDDDCAPAPSMLRRMEATPALETAIGSVPGGAVGLLKSRILTPEGIDRFLAAAGATEETRARFASTDDNLYLEYSTPRGNAREYEETFRANVAGFMAFTPGSEVDGTHLARR